MKLTQTERKRMAADREEGLDYDCISDRERRETIAEIALLLDFKTPVVFNDNTNNVERAR